LIQNEQTQDNGAFELTITLATPTLARILAEAQINPDKILPEEEAKVFRRTLEHFEQVNLERAQARVKQDMMDDLVVDEDALMRQFEEDTQSIARPTHHS